MWIIWSCGNLTDIINCYLDMKSDRVRAKKGGKAPSNTTEHMI